MIVSRKKIITVLVYACSTALCFANTSTDLLHQAHTLFAEKNITAAIECAKQAIAADAHNVSALILYGELLMNVGKEKKAYKLLKEAAELNPQDHHLKVKLANNLLWVGNNLYNRHETQQALDVYNIIAELFPNSATALHNIGSTLAELNRPHEALSVFERVLAIKPDVIGTHFSLGLALLSLGDYTRGWEEYEWRWKKNHQTLTDLPYPVWNGSDDLAGKTILLRTEGALGDSIQFVRYAQLIKAMGATTIVQTLQPLKKLFSYCPFIDTVITNQEIPSTVDYQVSLMSLPFLCNTTVETVPCSIPYLHVDSTYIEYWNAYLNNVAENKFRIGLCWQADPHNDLQRPPLARRTVPVQLLAPLAAIPGVQLFSLHHGTHEDTTFNLHIFGDDFDKTNGRFIDTAAVIKNLDLVITVDTSIAHLSGALGTPTWVLLPFKADWRWIVDRNDTPWYPCMWLLKKDKDGTWQDLIEKIVLNIKQII